MAKKIRLGPGRKANVMPRYPHMLNEDRDVWSDFLEAGKYMVSEVWYDLHVGAGLPLPAGADEQQRKISQGVTRKRIDVVCRVGKDIWIVEIKPLGNMKALGQALTYKRLFDNEYDQPEKTIPVVICDMIDNDLKQVYESYLVKVIVNSPG